MGRQSLTRRKEEHGAVFPMFEQKGSKSLKYRVLKVSMLAIKTIVLGKYLMFGHWTLWAIALVCRRGPALCLHQKDRRVQMPVVEARQPPHLDTVETDST